MIPFAEWLPDLSDLNNPGATVAKNVLPHPMGYKPLPAAQGYSAALAAACVGSFYARDKSNNVYVYAGTTTKLYQLVNDGWTEVTRSTGGDYATGTNERWEYVKWNETVVATNFTDVPQVITLGATNFAALGGSPPRARNIAIARNFVILGNINDSGGDGLVPNRVQWSGINDSASWAISAVTQADEEDLKGGGWVQRVFGGEYAVVFQEDKVWRMSYVGSPVIWQFDEVVPASGLLARGMAAQHGDDIYFLSPRGFMVLQHGSQAQMIGANKIDKFVLNDIDTNNLARCESVVDSSNHRVYFAYPGSDNVAGLPNRLVVYDYSIGRWSYSEQDTEAFLIAATSGYTIDSLDSISTNLDSILVSLDDDAWTGGRPQLAKFGSDHKLSFFTGSPMTATVETSEVELTKSRRTLLTDTRPLVDGGTVTVQLGSRNKQGDNVDWTSAKSVNGNGRANIRKNARYMRFRANLSGTWDDAQGIEPEGSAAGWR